MEKYLQLFTVLLSLVFAVGCPIPEASDTTSPDEPGNVTFGETGLTVGGQPTAAANAALVGGTGTFKVGYTFGTGKEWESGTSVVLYLKGAKIATATKSTATEATFNKLPAGTNLTDPGDLVLKFVDSAGNASPGITLLDNTMPTITGAELVNTTATLTMSEALAARAEITGTGGFTLTGRVATGTATTFAVTNVAAVTADATTVTLTVNNPAQEGETVTLTYQKPAAEVDRIKDKAGLALDGIANDKAISVAVKEDTAAPTIAKAEHDGTTITLTLSEALRARTEITGTGGFTLIGKVASGTATTFAVTKVAAVIGGAKTVALTVDKPAQTGETVKLTYIRPADADRIKDAKGNALASIAKENAVDVTKKPSDAKQLTAFSFAAAGNDALTADVTGTVTQPATAGANGTIAVTVPNNTVVTALKATFAASAEATVSIGTAAQTSGTTANDFTNPVTYTVKAENGSDVIDAAPRLEPS